MEGLKIDYEFWGKRHISNKLDLLVTTSLSIHVHLLLFTCLEGLMCQMAWLLAGAGLAAKSATSLAEGSAWWLTKHCLPRHSNQMFLLNPLEQN
jgi:hypothetical protein